MRASESREHGSSSSGGTLVERETYTDSKGLYAYVNQAGQSHTATALHGLTEDIL